MSGSVGSVISKRKMSPLCLSVQRTGVSVMNTSEDTSTISCNAFSPARSTLGKNKIKSMTNNDV